MSHRVPIKKSGGSVRAVMNGLRRSTTGAISTAVLIATNWKEDFIKNINSNCEKSATPIPAARLIEIRIESFLLDALQHFLLSFPNILRKGSSDD
jgi:hypothetical protein